MMQRLCLVLVLTLLSTLVIAAPSKPKKLSAAAMLTMQKINARVAEINGEAKLRVDSNDKAKAWLGYQPEGGGTLYSYRIGDELVKIVAEFVHAFGMVRLEFYYTHGEPSFIYEREDYFVKKKSGEPNREKVEYGHDARFYIDKRALVESKRRGKDRFGTPSSAETQMGKLLAMSDHWTEFWEHKR